MATTTPNFGWSVPTSTDLVKDGATAIETLGDSIDASLVDLKGGTSGQVLKKNSNTDMDFVWSADSAGMTNPMTTTGDTIYSSSGSTPARLGIGTTGQVLTVAAGLPSWATPTAGGTGGYTLLNTGGTTLTGAATITVSSITSNDLLIYVYGAQSNTASSYIQIKFNSSSNNHNSAGMRIIAANTYNNDNFDQIADSNTGSVGLFYTADAASRPGYGYCMVQAATSSSIKPYWFAGANDSGGSGNSHWSLAGGGYFAGSAITSVSLVSSAGNFNGGTLYIYGRS